MAFYIQSYNLSGRYLYIHILYIYEIRIFSSEYPKLWDLNISVGVKAASPFLSTLRFQ